VRPLVSVVLPTYERASTLARAIDSVLCQTFADFELIVVDDTSTDDTPGVLRRYAGCAHVRVLSQRRRGCSAARNLGIRAARGRYVAFQDSDDEWVPHKLATAVAALEGVGVDTGVFYSDMLRIHRDGRRADFRAPEVAPGVLVDERTLDYQVYGIGIQSAVIKRACFDLAGDFDEALPRFIDLDLFIRLSDRFRFVHCPQMLVHYHDVDGISTDRHARVVARRRLLRKYRSRLRRHPNHLAHQYVLLARALEDTGHTFRALLCHLRALRTLPRDAGIRLGVREVIHRLKHETLTRYPLTP
jgi:glycosyltransferase involved in cell wall biosynthesis